MTEEIDLFSTSIFASRSLEDGEENGYEIMEDIAAFEFREDFSTTLFNFDSEDLDACMVLASDHLPSELDYEEPDPNTFYITITDEELRIQADFEENFTGTFINIFRHILDVSPFTVESYQMDFGIQTPINSVSRSPAVPNGFMIDGYQFSSESKTYYVKTSEYTGDEEPKEAITMRANIHEEIEVDEDAEFVENLRLDIEDEVYGMIE